jgi:hypothetical protein
MVNADNANRRAIGVGKESVVQQFRRSGMILPAMILPVLLFCFVVAAPAADSGFFIAEEL